MRALSLWSLSFSPRPRRIPSFLSTLPPGLKDIFPSLVLKFLLKVNQSIRSVEFLPTRLISWLCLLLLILFSCYFPLLNKRSPVLFKPDTNRNKRYSLAFRGPGGPWFVLRTQVNCYDFTILPVRGIMTKHQKIDRRRDRTCNLLIRSQAPCHWASRP